MADPFEALRPPSRHTKADGQPFYDHSEFHAMVARMHADEKRNGAFTVRDRADWFQRLRELQAKLEMDRLRAVDDLVIKLKEQLAPHARPGETPEALIQRLIRIVERKSAGVSDRDWNLDIHNLAQYMVAHCGRLPRTSVSEDECPRPRRVPFEYDQGWGLETGLTARAVLDAVQCPCPFQVDDQAFLDSAEHAYALKLYDSVGSYLNERFQLLEPLEPGESLVEIRESRSDDD